MKPVFLASGPPTGSKRTLLRSLLTAGRSPHARALLITASILATVIPVLAILRAQQADPVVRIGLNQNASTVTIRSAQAFQVEQNTTRTAKFTAALALDP